MPLGEIWRPSTPQLHRFVSIANVGSLAAATYAYRMTMLTPAGESLPSDETPLITTAANGAIALFWSPIPGATGYRIYGRSTSGAGLATAPTGGVLVGGLTYAYSVTAVNATGESLPNDEAPIVVPAGTNTNTVTLTWSAVAGATGYRVYGRYPSRNVIFNVAPDPNARKGVLLASFNTGSTPTPGVWVGSDGTVLAGQTTATSFIDTGVVPPSGAAPSVVRTGTLQMVNAPTLVAATIPANLTTYTDVGGALVGSPLPTTNLAGLTPPTPPQYAVGTTISNAGEALLAPLPNDSRWFRNIRERETCRLYIYLSNFSAPGAAFINTRVWLRSGFLNSLTNHGAVVGHLLKTSTTQIDTPSLGTLATPSGYTEQGTYSFAINGDDILVQIESFNAVLGGGGTAVIPTACSVSLYLSFT